MKMLRIIVLLLILMAVPTADTFAVTCICPGGGCISDGRTWSYCPECTAVCSSSSSSAATQGVTKQFLKENYPVPTGNFLIPYGRTAEEGAISSVDQELKARAERWGRREKTQAARDKAAEAKRAAAEAAAEAAAAKGRAAAADAALARAVENLAAEPEDPVMMPSYADIASKEKDADQALSQAEFSAAEAETKEAAAKEKAVAAAAAAKEAADAAAKEDAADEEADAAAKAKEMAEAKAKFEEAQHKLAWKKAIEEAKAEAENKAGQEALVKAWAEATADQALKVTEGKTQAEEELRAVLDGVTANILKVKIQKRVDKIMEEERHGPLLGLEGRSDEVIEQAREEVYDRAVQEVLAEEKEKEKKNN